MDLSPDGTPARFNFIFKVWRPAPNVTVTGCYSLVDDFISISIPIGIQPISTINVARITPSPADQLQFQPGDVLGFYVESHGEFPMILTKTILEVIPIMELNYSL